MKNIHLDTIKHAFIKAFILAFEKHLIKNDEIKFIFLKDDSKREEFKKTINTLFIKNLKTHNINSSQKKIDEIMNNSNNFIDKKKENLTQTNFISFIIKKIK